MCVTELPVTGAGLLSEGRCLNQTLTMYRHQGAQISQNRNLHPSAPYSKWLCIEENLLGNVGASFCL